MDPTRFDALVKSLTSSGSRRRLLGGVLAGSLTPLITAAKSQPGHRRRDHDHDRDHANGHDRSRARVDAPGSPDAGPAAATRAHHGPEPAKCLAVGKRCSQSETEVARHGNGKGRRKGKGKRHPPACTKCCSRFGSVGPDDKPRCSCKPEGETCDGPSQCCGGLCRNGQCTNCPGDLTACNGNCVDRQTDPDHCGDCDTSCANGQRCVDGACVCDGASCPNGCCDDRGTCQRGTSDQACGDGGAACQACGECATCDGTTCVARSNGCCGDQAICQNGACTPCGADQRCRNGACGCDAGFHRCGEQCVADNDVAHCGASCDPCPTSICSPATCDGATCGRAPIAGCCETSSECGDDDVCTTDTCDPATHTCRHTANEGAACGDGGLCCGGGCCVPPANARPVCPTVESCTFACDVGFHRCGDQCFSDTDVAHCGDACIACPTDQNGTAICSGGTCGIACDAGFALCGGACCGGCCNGTTCAAIENQDNATCGAQGAACSACPADAPFCVHGVCVCPSGRVCSGTCCITGDVCDATSRTCCSPPTTTCPVNACGTIDDGCGRPIECPACPICHTCDADTHACGAVDDNSPCGEGVACCGGVCTDIESNANCGTCGTSCPDGDSVVCMNGSCCQLHFRGVCNLPDLPCCDDVIGCTDGHCCTQTGGFCDGDDECCGTCDLDNFTCLS